MTNRAAFRSRFSRNQPVDPVASLVSSNTAGLAGALRIALTGLETRLSDDVNAYTKRIDAIARGLTVLAGMETRLDAQWDVIAKRIQAVERTLEDLLGLRAQVATLEAKPDPDFRSPLETIAKHLVGIGQAIEGLSRRVDHLEAKDIVAPNDIAGPLKTLAGAVKAVEAKDVIGPLKSLATAVKAVKAPPDRVSKPLGSIVSLIEEIRQMQLDMRREMADRPAPVEHEGAELDITELKNVLNQDYEVVRDRDGTISGWRPKRG